MVVGFSYVLVPQGYTIESLQPSASGTVIPSRPKFKSDTGCFSES